MEVRFLTDKESSKAILQLILASDHVSFAVAWAGPNRVVSSLLENNSKIARGLIGTHMYRTSPDVLNDFIGVGAVRYMPPTGKLFHPKIYAFSASDNVSVIIGSHNLTAAAFEGGNVEASMLISGVATDPALRDLMAFVDRAWRGGKAIEDDDFLFSYRIQHKVNQGRNAALEKFHPMKRPRDSRLASPLLLSWAAFVEGVRDEEEHTFKGRLSILDRAHALFVQCSSFARMALAERRAIAGTYGRKEPQLDGHDWGWFGSMVGQGDFKNLINETSGELSGALDQIPLFGDVTEGHYTKFVSRFRRAFKDKSHKGGVATASRLLAMKRPDWFVAVNKANRDDLCAALAVAPTTLSLDNYWSSIVVPITMSEWWNHPRPVEEDEAHIWIYRAALLDSHYYEPMM